MLEKGRIFAEVSMGEPRIPDCVLKLICTAVLIAWLPVSAQAQSSAAPSGDVQSVPVYVADFELPALGAVPAPSGKSSTEGFPTSKPEANKTPSGATPAKSPAVIQESDTPAAQARRLMDFFALTLVEALQKNGYTAKRLLRTRAENGVALRGVFTEIDPMNRVHKANLGGVAPGTKYVLYVGTFNMSRPDLPLYELAIDESPDSRFGPVITLNNYIPMAKYELDKHPTEDEIRKICEQIVWSLTELLKANPAAFGE